MFSMGDLNLYAAKRGVRDCNRSKLAKLMGSAFWGGIPATRWLSQFSKPTGESLSRGRYAASRVIPSRFCDLRKTGPKRRSFVFHRRNNAAVGAGGVVVGG